MKTVLTILAITLLPFLSTAQEANTDINNDDTIETVIENNIETQVIKSETAAASAVKAQIIKINRKKSSEIISIKAYRKSLHIKVKEVRVC
ncbi:hypothetical protein [Psychroserpens ponticola]|uniref:Uncharacterized protein n=1 Tax=Psychroserpens ponticola TaxID=2932268 RepID=A0ABY7RYA1_9FLAO|nr:hypothetical protein [Psychroserpens ponticola]WCO02013.1 hypothetical protein MUN68_000635 [Psychroserpens ponticola]